MNRPTLYAFFLFFFIFGCDQKPAVIEYGISSCHACKMSIVDQQHASQIMTIKGRTYSFDAIECMVRSLSQWDDEELRLILVTDYVSRKKLIDAQTAHYLISKAIPSPMGANLSAFANEENRDNLFSSPGDKRLSWNELKLSLN